FALALLICGNGMFKPNVSTIVGSLYRPGSAKRDDGFNIFYMGINLGAAIAPLLCGYVGENYGWHYGFGLATIGMMVGLAVFVMPTRLTQLLIGSAAAASAVGMIFFRPDNPWAIAINIFLAAALAISATISVLALSKGGLPEWAGARPEEAPRQYDWAVYLGIALAVPFFAGLVCGFSPFLSPEDEGDDPKKQKQEAVAFLEGFGVESRLIEEVKKHELRPTKPHGASLQIISEETVFAIKNGFPKEIFDRLKEPKIGKEVLEIIKSGKQTDPKNRTQVLEALKKAEIPQEVIDQVMAGGELPKKTLELLEKPKVDKEILEIIESGKQRRKKNREKVIAALREAGVSEQDIQQVMAGGGSARQIAGVFVKEMSKPAGLVLMVLGVLAFGYLIIATLELETKPRQRMTAALILIFFQMLFFAFFEQAGSSLTNFTDRNIDRVAERSIVTPEMVGKTIRIQPTQEQLGYERKGEIFTMGDLTKLRKLLKDYDRKFTIEWPISESNVGMGIAEVRDELAASSFQAVNPTYILILALVFNMIWARLRNIGWEPSAGVKFALGLVQLGLGFGAFWLGAQTSNERGMVHVGWLLLGYLLHTSGELCLSPVGLSVMTKLAPKALVSTLMGSWFLATAFSQYLAAIISQFTGVGEGSGGDLPAPKDTVHIYGDVFGQVAIVAVICGLVCFAISPLLKRWMHLDELGGE
ncbi:MAG TPA: hypothetical protein ENJ16_02520, partial [Planctomycetaceae bacterium]|nr:hypothetical protein [Planctomycetaceae bacterium]